MTRDSEAFFVDKETLAYAETVAHVRLVQSYLLSAQQILAARLLVIVSDARQKGIALSILSELSRRAVTHDSTKLIDPEWASFAALTHKLADLTYGSQAYEEVRQTLLAETLGHHYRHNRHHPEHYANGIYDMNLFDLLEMLIDWKAATRRHKDGDIVASLQINKKRFRIADQLHNLLVATEPLLSDQFSALITQRDLVPSPSGPVPPLAPSIHMELLEPVGPALVSPQKDTLGTHQRNTTLFDLFEYLTLSVGHGQLPSQVNLSPLVLSLLVNTVPWVIAS